MFLASWNDREQKYDIRECLEEHEKLHKGVTFTLPELQTLKAALNELLDID